MSPDPLDARPIHPWNDPDGDGHNCADCPPDSMWKCDRDAHLNGPFDVLSDQQRADLDANLREMAAIRRRGRSTAATMPLP